MDSAKTPAPIRWAPRVRPEKLRRLYESEARGILDEELLDDVGTTIYCRCRDILIISDAAEGRVKCLGCTATIARRGDDRDQMLTCPKCGWKCAWGDFQKSYRHHELVGRGLTEALVEFMQRWGQARVPREKMRLIDRLIHVWHWESRTDHAKGRPAAVNLIEGSRRQALNFLDELSAASAAEPSPSLTKHRASD
ncbi:MAG: hypothetical protein WAU33_08795 [Candidatus Binataceae bacterium]